MLIQEVSPGMPAAEPGFQAHDMVTVINDNPVREQDDLFVSISPPWPVGGSRSGAAQASHGRSRPGWPSGPGRVATRPSCQNARCQSGLRVDYASVLGVGASRRRASGCRACHGQPG